MKRILTLLVCLVFLTVLAVPVSAEGAIHLSISASAGSAYRGDSITFYIYASGGGTCDRFGLALGYDTSVFEYVGGSHSVAGADYAGMDSTGLFAAYGAGGSPSGLVGTFTLRVRSDAPFITGSVWGSASAGGASATASGTAVTVYCNHSYGAWHQYDESYHQKDCGICGGTSEEGHAWNEGTLVSAPSCKEEGSKTYTCTVCGQVINETLAKTDDHNYATPVSVDATNHKSVCSICGGELVLPHSWDGGTVTKTETCKETGIRLYTCTGCADTREETIPLSENHRYSAWAKVDDSKHHHKCSVCNKEETLDHTWNGGSVTKKPNCVETGTALYTCTGCSTTRTEELPVTGVHTYDHGCDPDCNICGATRSTSHTYGSSWSKNADQHWKTCLSCGNKADTAAHTPGAEATEYNPQVCTVCEYILKPELAHEHQYAEEFVTDEEGHWYPCKGCEERKDYATHAFDNNCDGLCETCGYTRQTSHDISEEWFADFVNHYQKCVSCGHEEEHIRHNPGPQATESDPQLCEVCGYELMPALGHSFSKDWSSDGEVHFHSCQCGAQADVQPHVWDEGVRHPDGTQYSCTVCLYQKVEPRDLTWVIYVGAAVVAAGGVAVFALKKKKK